MPKALLAVLLSCSIPSVVCAQDDSFRELKIQRSVQLCVYFLDGYLGLSEEQHLAMEELLRRSWSKNEGVITDLVLWVGYDSGDKLYEAFPRDKLEDVLTKDQLRQFETLIEHGLEQTDQLAYLRGTTGALVDPIDPVLSNAIQIEVARLNRLVQLKEKQLRVLRVAAKGAAKEVLAERQEYRERITEGGLGGLQGFEWVQVAVMGPVFRIQKTKTWNKAIKKVLTEEQFEVFLEDLSRRTAVASKVCSHSLAMSYLDRIEISEEEYLQFTKLIEDGIEEAIQTGNTIYPGPLAFEVVNVVLDLDDEHIRDAISPKCFEVVQPLLARLRATRDRNLGQ